MLTATQEDYLEAIYRIEEEGGEVRISLLADRLGCRLPTVTRTIRKLVELGFVDHRARGAVRLTRSGRPTAGHLVHRHEDLVRFLTRVLGLTPAQAEADTRQLEHGMSPLAAQRLHQWLIHLERLEPEERERYLKFEGRQATSVPDFDRLPEGRVAGWRG